MTSRLIRGNIPQMNLDESDIEKIAALAKLKLDSGGKQKLLVDLNTILSHMIVIDEADLGELQDGRSGPGGKSPPNKAK